MVDQALIDYGKFQFASLPRTGGTWFMQAAAAAGLGEGQKAHLHKPPPADWQGGLILTTVRDPYYWLRSYFFHLQGGVVGDVHIDTLVGLARQANNAHGWTARGFAAFLRMFLLQRPGVLWHAHAAYNANNVLRTEDLGWATAELFLSLGVPMSVCNEIRKRPRVNATKKIPVIRDDGLKRAVYEAEGELCERYEYGY